MSTSTSPRRNRVVIAVAGTVLAGSLGLGAVSLTGGGDGRPAAGSPAASSSASSSASPAPSGDAVKMPDQARRQAGDPRALGRADAPVVLVEYADFQCPFCGKFARDVQPKLMKYVDDGTLRVEWRDFPIFGAESQAAARAGQAAASQGRFWEFHRVAYAEDRKRNSGAFTTEKLVEIAREAGVPDLAKFRADIGGAAAREAVERDSEEGYGLGVPSTPAFLVNGQPVLGAQPYGAFEAAIERAAEIAEKEGQ
ncbi:thioredoxin domain-containing protein [Spirillospora sp. NPDC047418]|jgi:protein-disulfide isomerase